MPKIRRYMHPGGIWLLYSHFVAQWDLVSLIDDISAQPVEGFGPSSILSAELAELQSSEVTVQFLLFFVGCQTFKQSID